MIYPLCLTIPLIKKKIKTQTTAILVYSIMAESISAFNKHGVTAEFLPNFDKSVER